MASTDFDIVLNGTKAKLKRGVEGSYRKRYVRREIQQQLISQSEDGSVLSSRDDYARLMQSSWAGGATWWKPIIRSGDTDSYFQGNNMDTWSEPGKVLPGNSFSGDDGGTELTHINPVVASDGTSRALFTLSNTTNVNASFKDVYKWTPASDDWVQETGYHSATAGQNNIGWPTFDPTDGYVYVIDNANSQINRFNPDSASQDNSWVSITDGADNGAGLIAHRQGLLCYNGQDLYLIDKSGPSMSQVFSDGFGQDAAHTSQIWAGGTPSTFHSPQIINTPEGIYYFKNAYGEGRLRCYVFRIDRNSAGSWIGEPIATLPAGTIGVTIAYHLGSVIIAALGDEAAYFAQEDQEVSLYSIDQNGISVLGSPLGRDQVDETPAYLLGSIGPYLYLAGKKRLWVYDGARGGVHAVTEWNGDAGFSTIAPYRMMAAENSSGESTIMFSGLGTQIVKASKYDDPDTVTNFGDDETHYTLESNYFDFNLPFETKELSKVEIEHDAIDANGNQEWTVQIAADDGSFSDILTNSTADSTYASATLSGTSGRRFRYKLIYQTKDTERIPLRGLLISASGGENIAEYELILDGEELLNVDNEVQSPEAFYDALETIAGTETQITFSDNFQELEQETDTGTTSQMKVRAVEINKDTPGESMIQVVLRAA